MASLVANSVAILAARLLVPIFAFVINLAVARVLGVEGLGAFVYLMGLLAVFQTAAGAGLPLLLTRDIAAHPERTGEFLRDARRWATVSCAVVAIVFVGYALFLAPANRRLAAIILSASLLPSGWMAVQEGFFMARREHHLLTVVAFAEGALKLVLAGVVFLLHNGLLGLCVAITVSRFLAFGIGERLMRRERVASGGPLDIRAVLRFARIVAPWVAIFTLSILYFRIDIILVQSLLGDTAAGLYGAAASLFAAVVLLPGAAMSAVYPRLAKVYRESRDGYARATILALKLLVAGTVPFSLLLLCAGPYIVSLLYGSAFASSVDVLRLLALSLPFHAANGVLGMALQAGHLQSTMLRVVAVALALEAALMLVFIPRFGIAGAAVALLISSAFSMVLLGVIFHRQTASVLHPSRVMLTAAALYAPVLWTWLLPPTLAPVAAIFGFVLLALAMTSFTLERSDLQQIALAFRPRRAAASP